jgi:Uma2 family endonuclease
MIQTPLKIISLEEFLQLPETKPACEFVNNQIVPKPMPKGQHSTIQRQLIIFLSAILSPQKIARVFPELRCTFVSETSPEAFKETRSIVPDIAVFTEARIPRLANGKIANTFNLAPDWTIEILSPEQSAAQVLKNISYCLEHGSQMGWLIDPESESVFVSELGNQFSLIDDLDISLPFPLFVSMSNLSPALTGREIFGWLND